MKTTIKSLTLALALCAAAFLTTSFVIEKTATPDKYIIRDYQGRVAVFRYGEDEPEEVFEVFTSSLPESECERISKGITVKSDEELQSLIEDYTG
ncbi:MAG: BofC C-terminal domain-containing protein [Acutalibacteraceae bacterium]